MKKLKIINLIMSFCLIFSSCGEYQNYFSSTPDTHESFNLGEQLEIQYIDVGQGDSQLIFLPNGETMLIDGGDTFCSDTICQYLKNENVEKIDFLVATHPHADHIGGLDDVLNEISVETLIMPKVADSDIPTTKTYEYFLDSVINNGCEVVRAKPDISLIEDEEIDLYAKCLGPQKDDYSDLNNYSAVILIEYKSHSFLFMGDALFESENELLNQGEDISADILKIGHHGSHSSTGDEFLEEVNPQYAIVSAGVGNRYGHPHDETMEKLEENGIEIYRTDRDGTIVAKSDGTEITIETNQKHLY